MRRSLRNRLLAPLLVVALAGLAAVAAVGSWTATRVARSRITGRLEGVAQVLGTSNFPLTPPVLRRMADLAAADLLLVGPAGEPLASTLEGPPPALPRVTLSEASPVALSDPLRLGGRTYLHAALRVHRPGEPRATLHVLYPGEEYRSAWLAAFWPQVAVGGLAVAVAALVANAVAVRVGETAHRLGEQVRRFSHGDFATTPPPNVKDELHGLAEAINLTAERLADYETQVRRTEQLRTLAVLGAGLAHEMRNAATGARMAVDLHAQACPGGGEDESLAVARRQLEVMERRLQRFLKLGKASPALDLRALDLGELVADLLPLVEPAARHAGVALRWSPPESPARVRADPEELGQAVVNLLLNAVEAARCPPAAGGPSTREQAPGVEVRVAPVGADAELTVRDTGPGPPAAVAPGLFEPFVTSHAEGVGLGLAVARQVVDAHGGRIDWFREPQPGGGLTCFRVSLPRLSP